MTVEDNSLVATPPARQPAAPPRPRSARSQAAVRPVRRASARRVRAHQPARISPALLPYLWMLLGSLAFACMGGFTYALRGCDWLVLAAVRTGLAVVFAVWLARAGGAQLVFFRPRLLWMRSLAGCVSLVCNFYALTHLPVADVLTLSNTFPIWVAVLSWPLLKVLPRWDVWASVAVGVVGVIILQQPQLAAGNLATWAALGGAFSTAVAMIGLHRLHAIDPRAIVVHFSIVGFLCCLVLMVAWGRLPGMPGGIAWHTLAAWPTWVMLIGLGASATVGQLMLTKAFGAGAPAKVSVVGLTQVGFGMLLDVIFWHRQFTADSLLGTALVVAPTAWILLRPALRGSGAAVQYSAQGAGEATVGPTVETTVETVADV